MTEAARQARIEPLAPRDAARVSTLAREIWLAHYPGIISVEQIEYMLAQRYDPARIRAELERGASWWDVLKVDGDIAAFAAYFPADEPRAMKLDKLYVHPRQHRRGYGGMLVGRVCAQAAARGCARVVLAVNRNNRQAIAAYGRYGFRIREAVVQDIGGGFVMDDYVMVREIA